ncbi:IS66 family insertion sequence element accessory protein TnpB [Heyndrickxia sporothermodurans]|uniref:IS66 family insertion sequence element accessory protein TnpB n=1 Tax=Heyndrickxia sporothermodurans TaxID=46224 RepID=A0AB37HG00_9BACI|nr:IS66 family insertion sequence element accessory protein TnpB [Heyndrickxia sporothermodurans]
MYRWIGRSCKRRIRVRSFSSSLFVFVTARDKLKILQWDHNGFWLYYRRLERGNFH